MDSKDKIQLNLKRKGRRELACNCNCMRDQFFRSGDKEQNRGGP